MNRTRSERRDSRQRFINRRVRLETAADRVPKLWKHPGEYAKTRRVYVGRKCKCEVCSFTPYNRPKAKVEALKEIQVASDYEFVVG